jgi:hypothetical protein
MTKEATDTSQQLEKEESVLDFIESNFNDGLLDEFKATNSANWEGDPTMKGLFHFWKKILLEEKLYLPLPTTDVTLDVPVLFVEVC